MQIIQFFGNFNDYFRSNNYHHINNSFSLLSNKTKKTINEVKMAEIVSLILKLRQQG